MTTNEKTVLTYQVKGITVGIIITFILGFGGMAIGGHKWATDILLAIERGNGYNAIQDVQIKALQVQVDKLEVEIGELKKQAFQ